MKWQARGLQEEVEAQGHRVPSYPRLTPSSSSANYQRRAKRFARGNRGHGPEAPKEIVRKAPARESNAFIRGIYKLALRAIDGHSVGLQYGAEEFEKTVNEPHRRVGGMSEYAIVSVA